MDPLLFVGLKLAFSKKGGGGQEDGREQRQCYLEGFLFVFIDG